MNDRDTFAAAALTGLLASQQTVLYDSAYFYSASAMASQAYEYADAMLAARGDKTPVPPAAGVTLTDAEWWAVEEGREALRHCGAKTCAALLTGLLARAAKEGQ